MNLALLYIPAPSTFLPSAASLPQPAGGSTTLSRCPSVSPEARLYFRFSRGNRGTEWQAVNDPIQASHPPAVTLSSPGPTPPSWSRVNLTSGREQMGVGEARVWGQQGAEIGGGRHCGGCLRPTLAPQLLRIRPINGHNNCGWWRWGYGVAPGRCAKVRRLPALQPGGPEWHSGPRFPSSRALPAPLRSVHSVTAGWQHRPACPRSSRSSPLPARPVPDTSYEGSALTLLFPELSFPFHEMGRHSGRWGHSEVRLLLSFHFFLCLNFPAYDYLQRPFHRERSPSAPLRTAAHLPPPSLPI